MAANQSLEVDPSAVLPGLKSGRESGAAVHFAFTGIIEVCVVVFVAITIILVWRWWNTRR
ncbi:hypothetical protein GOB93_20550 [Acetobacter musti]|uniref:Uncharacterized protein n=1 Tax=Acetobacter musti TaxID=864732 RepID=A0ABX0JWL5_9PROT|nr:hypothetical protein [Acetobacter musti]NHN86946.1 hypothetical protein [Acetobacter musti]